MCSYISIRYIYVSKISIFTAQQLCMLMHMKFMHVLLKRYLSSIY